MGWRWVHRKIGWYYLADREIAGVNSSWLKCLPLIDRRLEDLLANIAINK